jgi:uncharacterized membrane protein
MRNDVDSDQLVADYLRRLQAAAAGLPADRRAELVEEIAGHITEARAAGGGSAASVRTMLDRLGQPEDIVRAADDPAAAGPAAPSRTAGARGRDIAAVILLLAGAFLAGFGWLVGLYLLWSSPRWGRADKILGTLVWPAGLLGAAALGHVASRGAAGLGLVVLLVAAAIEIVVSARLLRQSAAAAVRRPADLAAGQPA